MSNPDADNGAIEVVRGFEASDFAAFEENHRKWVEDRALQAYPVLVRAVGDVSLSRDARWLLALIMLNEVQGVVFDVPSLAQAGGCHHNTIRGLLRELRDAGLIGEGEEG